MSACPDFFLHLGYSRSLRTDTASSCTSASTSTYKWAVTPAFSHLDRVYEAAVPGIRLTIAQVSNTLSSPAVYFPELVKPGVTRCLHTLSPHDVSTRVSTSTPHLSLDTSPETGHGASVGIISGLRSLPSVICDNLIVSARGRRSFLSLTPFLSVFSQFLVTSSASPP